MKTEKTRYYNDFTDDYEQSADQNFTLPENYLWVRTDIISRLLSAIIYFLAIIFSFFYCRLFLHMRICGKEKLRSTKGGCFIYGNHTQPVGDVFIPAHAALPKRIYTVVHPANYGIPFIGKILPYLGALPISESIRGIKELNRAIECRLDQGCPIVIYPEAHVWEYYSHIRPFPTTSFKYPVKFNKPTFSMTVTYKKTKTFKRPLMEVFIDGPFYPEGVTAKEKAYDLHRKVYDTMQKRSRNSDTEYIKYIRR